MSKDDYYFYEAEREFESWAAGHFGVLNMGKVSGYYSNPKVCSAFAVWFMSWSLAVKSCENKSTNLSDSDNINESEQS